MADKKLTVDDIEVPEGLLSAYMGVAGITHEHESRPSCRRRLAETLLWLAENPIVPSWNQLVDLKSIEGGWSSKDREIGAVVWQRRMFLRKPDPVPAEVKELEDQVNRACRWIDHVEALHQTDAAPDNIVADLKDALAGVKAFALAAQEGK
jgi:hypothetical protein